MSQAFEREEKREFWAQKHAAATIQLVNTAVHVSPRFLGPVENC